MHRMTNDDVVGFVTDELFWDPKLDSASIAVSADDGRVTLRGSVGTLAEKREAEQAAQKVLGVVSVDNELDIVLIDDDGKREDAKLRGDILQALMLNSVVPQTVDAQVYDGIVTLTGTVEWQYQRNEAERVAATIGGALEVVDETKLVSATPPAGGTEAAIREAFKRNARLEADRFIIGASNGAVTIEGVVSSWAEHDEALAAVWSVPGVTEVEDRVRIAYP